ncbi:MAG: aryl-alcohol dehydrogenase [Chlorobiaceae bacterium]|nr:aryl-alcohol dehydrogenase [Chlorobiaceae bacterium]
MNTISKFGLGTVQWGLHYGVANQQGITAPETVTALLCGARHYGIKVLDTASLYGKSEEVLGLNSLEGFKVVTKTPGFTTAHISDLDVNQLNATFRNSLNVLAQQKIYALLIHHAENLLVPGGEKLLSAMMHLKEKGLVEKIGVSVYDSSQLDAVLKKFKPDLVQLPLSVLDQRMLSSGHLELLKNDGIEIHVRSVFLQGLLLMSLCDIPAFFNPVRSLLTRFHAAAHAQGLTVSQAAIGFVKNIPFVDTVLIGLDNMEQFRSCIDDFAIEQNFDAAGLACSDPVFINPSHWQLK